jgi:hypothetical protein
MKRTFLLLHLLVGCLSIHARRLRYSSLSQEKSGA